MVYNYKKQRSPIVPMYTILGTSDGVPEKNGEDTRASKQQIRKIEDTPAPNIYSLPQVVGKTTQSNKRQAPCYSLTGRSNVGGIYKNIYGIPGPGTYSIYGYIGYHGYYGSLGRRGPEYSMTNRDVMPGDKTKKPGPGAHSPEYVRINKRSSPQFSFGIRHSQYTAPIIVDVQD